MRQDGEFREDKCVVPIRRALYCLNGCRVSLSPGYLRTNNCLPIE